MAQRLGRSNSNGALVVEVMRDSPAERGGIARGDIVLRVNDAEIVNYGDLVEILGEAAIGSTLRVNVWRNGRAVALTIRVAERK